jgi:hypothetical protein
MRRLGIALLIVLGAIMLFFGWAVYMYGPEEIGL